MPRWLAAQDDEELVALVARRLGRTVRAPTSFDQLASLLSAPQSCAEALRRLDRSAAQVVGVLAGGGGRATPQALAAALELHPAEVLAALRRAERQGLAWPAGDGSWRSPSGAAYLARQVLERCAPYGELLMHLGMVELRTLMGRLRLGSARSRQDALAVLEQALPQQVAASLADVPGARALLTAMAVSGDLPGDDAVVQDLVDRSLLVRVQGGTYLPAEVEEQLRAGRVVLDVAREPEQQSVVPGPAPVAAALRLLASAGRLIEVLAADPPKALVSGGLGIQVLRRLAKAAGSEVDEVVLLLQLLAHAGLVSTGQTAGAVTPRGLRWRSLPEEQAYVQLVRPQLHPQAVLEAPTPSPSGVLLGVPRTGRDLPTVRAVAEVAAVRGPETDLSLTAWLDWSAWQPGARSHRLRRFAQPLRVLELLALRGAGTPAPWLQALLSAEQPGPAPGLGGDEDEDAAEQSAAAAAPLLAAHLPPSQEDVVLQADGTAFVAGRPAAGLRALLDLLGERESEHTWRLSATAVREALDAGRAHEQLLAELAARAQHGVPGVVERLVRDVAAAHGRIELTAACTLLRLADPVLVVELLHDKRLRALGLVEVVPGIVASGSPPAAVAAALRAAGHAPVGEGATTAPSTAARAPRRPRPAPARPWGPSPQEVVAQLRRAPAPSPQLPQGALDGARLDKQVLDALWPRLRHLPGDEALLLVSAVARGGPVEIDYVDSGGAPTTRVVADLEDTGHLLVGHCRLRDAERMFAPLGILGVRPAS